MTPADRLRAHAEQIAAAMGLDPARIVVEVGPCDLHPGAAARALVACGGRGGGVWCDRRSFGATACGADEESAVDAAILALSTRLSTRARASVADARRAVEAAEWWQRVVAVGGGR